MANSEEPQTVFQEMPAFHEERSILASEPIATLGRRAGFWSQFLNTNGSRLRCIFF